MIWLKNYLLSLNNYHSLTTFSDSKIAKKKIENIKSNNICFFFPSNNDFIALNVAVGNLLGIQLLPSIPCC